MPEVPSDSALASARLLVVGSRHAPQQLIEARVLGVDGLAKPREVGVEFVESPGCQATRTALPLDSPHDETRLLEHLEMTRDRRLRDWQRLRELVHRRLPDHEPEQDRTPSRIRKSGETGIQMLLCGHIDI